MVNGNDPTVRSIEKQLAEITGDEGFRLRLDAALLMDSIQLFYETINNFNYLPEGLDCDANDNWSYGSTITNHMRTVGFFIKN